ncbi:MAG: hypothetical protein BWY03_00250 [Parcubacteria group bacterium ADurb.Bin159]|jgi:hypothetical protein|nr:MAG: hypothetical protein BWY03_00250 [Parcubacteria group bacterium ADurb.Bin159]
MVLIWQGNTTFKIILLDGKVIFIDPKKPVQADVILFTSEKNQIKDTGNSFIILGPGEYEVKGIFINARFLDKEHKSICYQISAENINLLFFSPIKTLPKDESSDLFLNTDILIFPIGLNEIKPSDISNFKKELEPKIFIPYYLEEDKQNSLKKVLAILNVENIKPIPHLKIQAKNLATKEQTILLSGGQSPKDILP